MLKKLALLVAVLALGAASMFNGAVHANAAPMHTDGWSWGDDPE